MAAEEKEKKDEEKTASPKATSAKKSASKKSTAKKASAKKTPAKKGSPKKRSAKKGAAESASAAAEETADKAASDGKGAEKKAKVEKPSKKKAAEKKASKKEAAEKKASKKESRGKKRKAAQTVLLTGFPGFIGSRLVKRLLQDDPNARIETLVLPHLAATAQRAIAGIDDALPGAAERIGVVTGDITEPDLGLARDVRKRLDDDVTSLWHLAAIYDLSVDEQLAYRVNVIGTSNVLDFCAQADRLKQLNYISTCYVAGDREGLVLESELDAGQEHHNHYEATKFWAELEVQRRWDEIPTAIFRPPIVVGDSQTGETDKYDGPYFLLRLLMKLPSWLPMVNVGRGDAVVSIAPVDFVVDAMATIAAQKDAAGKVYQLADPNPMRARDIVSLFLKVLGRRPPLGSVPSGVVEELLRLRPVRRLTGIPREAIVYFNHPVRFDVTNTLAALEGTDVRCPHLSTYVHTLLDYVSRNPEKEFLDHRSL